MSLPSLAVKVMGYEEQVDIEESTTNKTTTVTMYVTKVEATIDTKVKAVYFLRKRYSDFSTLFAALKDRIPDVENYKFPNKSIFNTSAQFTKDRRLSGFNDLLKLLVGMKPTPMEFGDFLEFSHHLGDNAIHFTAVLRGESAASSNNGTPSQLPRSIQGEKVRAQAVPYDNRDSFSLPPQQQPLDALFPNPKGKGTAESSGSAKNRAASSSREARQEEMLKILKQTFLLTVVFYVFCVVLGVVSVKSSTFAEMSFTIVAIASFLSLLRIGNLKTK